MPGFDDGHATLETVVLHDSGEWMAGVSGSPLQKNDPQGVGSALTYLRRYSLSGFAGIAQEDDDGNAASSTPRTALRASVTPSPSSTGDMIDCPECGGAMWDNREGKTNPKSPDLKCKDKQNCDSAIWLKSWRDDLLREIEVAFNADTIDSEKRTAMEDAVATLSPSMMTYTRKRLQELAA